MRLAAHFLLQGGHFLTVELPESSVKEIVHNWSSGWYRLKDINFIGSKEYPSTLHWGVRLDNIVAIHSIDLDLLQQEQSKSRQQYTPPPGYKGKSGIN